MLFHYLLILKPGAMLHVETKGSKAKKGKELIKLLI
jgi:hypothetical protein